MSKNIKGSTKKKTYDFVISVFEKEGYSLISKEYVNSRDKLHSICPKSHSYWVSLNLFLNRGFRCPKCSGNKPHTVDTVKAEFIKYGCTPMFYEYQKNTSPLYVKCPNNHDWFVSLTNLKKNGIHCSKCNGVVKRHSIEYVKNVFNKEGYELISDNFINSAIPLKVKCPKGHDWDIRFGDFYNSGYRCAKCSEKGTSAPEKHLIKIIENIFPSTQKLRDRRVKIENKPHIKGFDIDIFIPELNKGIEFDGFYHHSYEGLKRGRKWPQEDIRNYHEIKDSWFASKGIQILHIKEEDWIKDKEACVQKCLEFLGA